MLLVVDKSEANLVVIFEKSPTLVGVVMHLLSVSKWRSSDIGRRFSENAIEIFRVRDRNLLEVIFVFTTLYRCFFYYQVYNAVGKPLVDAVFSGFNGTLMAYGQTGTGELSMTHVWLFGKSTFAYFYIHVFGHIASCPVN